MAPQPLLSSTWSATGFGDPALDRYAASQQRGETRYGAQHKAGDGAAYPIERRRQSAHGMTAVDTGTASTGTWQP